MNLTRILILFTVTLFSTNIYAQSGCGNLGQSPGSAFPVCGTAVFGQTTVAPCGGTEVSNGCSGVEYKDKNAFWYQFTCYASGPLSFDITPLNQRDDYDWQLFDITGKPPSSVYSDAVFVSGNWSGSPGNTGAARGYIGNLQCASDPRDNVPTYNQPPILIKDHVYMLMVSHYTDINQSGYNLSFDDGGVVNLITDTTKPKMQNAKAYCDGMSVTVTTSKKVQCASLAGNGSDFSISPSIGVNVQSASGYNCSSGFDVDSIKVTLDKVLPPGNYSLIINKGTDGNTLLDNCDIPIQETDSIPFVVYALQPTPLDSLTPPGCAPDTLYLVFRNQIKCNTVAADGTDFFITGPSPVTIQGAAGNCNNGFTSAIKVWFTQPIKSNGNFMIRLQVGSDGNSLVDECGQYTPPGSALPFVTADTVSAKFKYQLNFGCTYDTLSVTHTGLNNVNEWNWTFDKNGTDTVQNPVFLFPDYGSKKIALQVSNGVCTDTSSQNILLDNELKSLFTAPKELCPENAAIFPDSSIGKIVSYYWIFGDGTTSVLRDPPPKIYPQPPTRDGRIYPVTLIVQDNINCKDTLSTLMKLLYTCYIDVPTGFTPNGDGLNDYLYPLNAYKAINLEFRVYNRIGQLVFETKDWTRKWNGTINGTPQSSGVYVWTLIFTDSDTGIRRSLKGTTVLIR